MMTDHLPRGFVAVTPYLLLEDARGFIEFAKAALGATERFASYDEGRLMHGELTLHGCVIELGEPKGDFTATRSSFHVFVPDVDAAHARAVEHGAEVLHEPVDQEYGERSSAVADRWGNQWYFARVIDHARRAT